MSKYIKWPGFALLLFCVLHSPLEASAKYVSGQGYGADFNVYEYVLDDYTEQIVVDTIGSFNAVASFVASASNGKEYLIVGYNGTIRFRMSVYADATKFNVQSPNGLAVFERIDGEWVLIQQKNQNSTVETDIPLGDTTIYVIREYTRQNITVFPSGIVLFSPSEPTILAPTPTPAPITKIDMSKTGFTESMSVALEFMRIPIEIAGFEVNMFEIMMFGFACTIVIYLVFAPVKK